MNCRIVTTKDISKCPKQILSASHWLPVHKVEECCDNLKLELKQYDARANIQLQLEIDELNAEFADDRDLFISCLRQKRK